ncbi:MAG TPA: hypothetical protein DF383_11375, partial [Deltaproteobacteria bacterium]|nr:hypothetical protein [Deltaproteobacteria bacterium]
MTYMNMNITENTNEFEILKIEAAKAFSPRTPISTKELFAGRLSQIKAIGDTVAQVGLHAVIFGERGVGKTSLTHIIAPVLKILDEHSASKQDLNRIVVRVNANGTDSFSSLWAKSFDEISWTEDRP